MSRYTDNMKQALVLYRDAKDKAAKRLQEVKEYFGDEAMQYEQERQAQQIKNARATAEAAIQEAWSEGRYLAEQWAKPNGSQLTDDMKLFDVGLVTPEVFDQLKARYRDNSTMLAALKMQGEKLNAAAQKEAHERTGNPFMMAEPYNVRDIVTGADKLNQWDSMKKQALDVLDALDGTGQYSGEWGHTVGAAYYAEIIEHFGEGM